MILINTLGLWTILEMVYEDLPPMGLEVDKAYCHAWQEARLVALRANRMDILQEMDPGCPKIACEHRSSTPARTSWLIDRAELALMCKILLGRL